MIRSNYHIHSDYCDGKNSLEEMLKASIGAGFTSMGFSSHVPVPFMNDSAMNEDKIQNYFQEVLHLKEKYSEVIEVYCGLEIDYFIDRKDIAAFSKAIIPQLDYFILSIHNLGSSYVEEPYFIDYYPENFGQGIEQYYHGDSRKFVIDYYQAIGDMALMYKPNILGHFDLIRKFNQNNRFFNDQEDWYKEAVCQCLDRISESRVIMEINTGAYLRVEGVGRYPADWIVPEMFKRDIPVTINGDSHSIEGINTKFDETEALLIVNGYKEYWALNKGHWEPKPLGI